MVERTTADRQVPGSNPGTSFLSSLFLNFETTRLVPFMQQMKSQIALLLSLSLLASGQNRIGDTVRILTGHTDIARCLYYTGSELFTSGYDGTIKSWNLANGQMTRNFTNPFRATAATTWPLGVFDGDILFTATGVNPPALFNLTTNQQVSGALSGRNFTVLYIQNAFLRRYNASSGQTLAVTGIHNNTLRSFVAYGDYEVFTSVYSATPVPTKILRWDMRNMKIIQEWLGHAHNVEKMVIDQGFLYSVSSDFHLNKWDIATGTIVYRLNHGASVFGVDVSGAYVFTGAFNQYIYQWDKETGALIRQYIGHTNYVTSIACAAPYMFSVSFDTTVRVWFIGDTSIVPTMTTQPSFALGSVNLNDVILTTTTSVFRDGNPGQGQQSSVVSPIETIAIAAAAVVVSLGVFCFFWLRRLKHSKQSSADQQTSASDRTTFTMTALTTMNTRNDSTLMVTVHELSIPGFMEMKYGLDYQQGGNVAQGGNSYIFICVPVSSRLERMVQTTPLVVKVVGESMDSLSSSIQKSFWQEVSLIWRMRDHPNFVKMYGYATEPVSILMKRYEYGNLRQFIVGSSLVLNFFRYSKLTLVGLFRQLCHGITYMHSQGYAHCDIKPANALLDIVNHSLLVIITDFGISRITKQNAVQVAGFQVSKIRGASLAYAAPEVLLYFQSQQPATPNFEAADTFALAATLFHMLERESPWSKQSTTKQ